jgi:hypothetical protein
MSLRPALVTDEETMSLAACLRWQLLLELRTLGGTFVVLHTSSIYHTQALNIIFQLISLAGGLPG